MPVQIEWINQKNQQERGSCSLQVPLYFGRDKHNDVILGGQRTGVSRRHACLLWQGGQLFLLDLDSTNGLYWQGQRVLQVLITDKTEVMIGAYLVRVRRQLQCANESCGQPVDDEMMFCPCCGQFVADAHTQQEIHQFVGGV